MGKGGEWGDETERAEGEGRERGGKRRRGKRKTEGRGGRGIHLRIKILATALTVYRDCSARYK